MTDRSKVILGQSLFGAKDASPTMTDQQLCAVTVPEEYAGPWAVTLYATTAGGGILKPAAPLPPWGNAPATITPRPWLSVGMVPNPLSYIRASAVFQLGPERIVCDWPEAGQVVRVSTCKELEVAVLASYAGAAAPNPMPRYSARIAPAVTEPAGLWDRPTYSWSVTAPPDEAFMSVVPYRATAFMVSCQEPNGTPATSDAFSVELADGAGTVLASRIMRAGWDTVFPQVQLGPWPIGRASQIAIVAPPTNVETYLITVTYFLSL